MPSADLRDNDKYPYQGTLPSPPPGSATNFIHPQFPWHAVQHYTLTTRNQIFAATRDQVKILVNNLKRGGGLNINQALLTELMIAGLNSSGFSESQRWELVQVSEYVGGEVKLSSLMKWWPWEALGRKAGSEEDVVQVWLFSFFRFGPSLVAFVCPTLISKYSHYAPTLTLPPTNPIQNILIPRSRTQQKVLRLTLEISPFRKEGFSTP